MKGKRFTVGAVLALALAASVALVATSIGSAKSQANFKMAIVTDIGSLQDRSFNQLANEGRIYSSKELKIVTRAYETKAESERIPNMLAASRAGTNLIFAIGFLNYSALNAVAPRFPKLQYAGIDIGYGLLSKKPKNTTGVIFAEQDAGYLVGYLAGLQIKKQGGDQVISAVGANNVPAIVRYISGYIQGAKKANPGDHGARELRERPDLQRPGEVQGDRPRADSEGLAGDLPGGRRLRPRRALSGQGRGHLGHRRRRRSALSRPAHVDERAQACERRRCRPHPARRMPAT